MRILGHSKGKDALSWFSFAVLELGPGRIKTGLWSSLELRKEVAHAQEEPGGKRCLQRCF